MGVKCLDTESWTHNGAVGNKEVLYSTSAGNIDSVSHIKMVWSPSENLILTSSGKSWIRLSKIWRPCCVSHLKHYCMKQINYELEFSPIK